MEKDKLIEAIVDRVERMVNMLPDEDGSIDVKVVLTNGDDKVVMVNCELYDLEDGSWDEEDMVVV